MEWNKLMDGARVGTGEEGEQQNRSIRGSSTRASKGKQHETQAKNFV